MDSQLKKAKYGLMITSYEISENGPNPVLSHIFWGNTIDEAIGYAKSHLITDYFFSSSFIGKMSWKGSYLILENEPDFIGRKITNKQYDKIMDELDEEAKQIIKKGKKFEIAEIINEIAE
jgi:hypothetical protein